MYLANVLLLFATFVASVILLAAIWQRKLMRRLSLFVALMIFFIVRAIVLLVGMKVFDPVDYLQLASFMSLVDLGLQLALAYSLARRFTQFRLETRHFAGRRLQDSTLFLFAVSVLSAGILTMLLISVLPDYSPVPLDRGIVFAGFVFLALLFVLQRTKNTAEGRLLLGFCIVSVANILSQCGRTWAGAQHAPRLFLFWAYANTVVWVGVLVFWILRLQATPHAARPLAGGTTAIVS